MFNKNYRPLSYVVNYENCDYDHLCYRFRQKMRAIESWLLSIQHISKNNYKLILFDDGCMFYDPLRNKILWTFDYHSSFPILQTRLEEIYRFYQYEKNCNYIKNQITRNDYFNLRKKYYGH